MGTTSIQATSLWSRYREMCREQRLAEGFAISTPVGPWHDYAVFLVLATRLLVGENKDPASVLLTGSFLLPEELTFHPLTYAVDEVRGGTRLTIIARHGERHVTGVVGAEIEALRARITHLTQLVKHFGCGE